MKTERQEPVGRYKKKNNLKASNSTEFNHNVKKRREKAKHDAKGRRVNKKVNRKK